MDFIAKANNLILDGKNNFKNAIVEFNCFMSHMHYYNCKMLAFILILHFFHFSIYVNKTKKQPYLLLYLKKSVIRQEDRLFIRQYIWSYRDRREMK